ncbi:MAG: hypothetical protein E7K72_00830 [Roseomonas mucosa]|nr:hypothetical protein [Roseomonas mucosa]
MTHRTIALLLVAALAVLFVGPEALRLARLNDWGAAVATLVVPFLVFVLCNLVVYVLARLLRRRDAVADHRATRLNYLGLAATLALLAARRGAGQ